MTFSIMSASGFPQMIGLDQFPIELRGILTFTIRIALDALHISELLYVHIRKTVTIAL